MLIYLLQQGVVDETKAVVPAVREKLAAAVEVLELQLVRSRDQPTQLLPQILTDRLQAAAQDSPAEEAAKANQAIQDAKAVLEASS